MVPKADSRQTYYYLGGLSVEHSHAAEVWGLPLPVLAEVLGLPLPAPRQELIVDKEELQGEPFGSKSPHQGSM